MGNEEGRFRCLQADENTRLFLLSFFPVELGMQSIDDFRKLEIAIVLFREVFFEIVELTGQLGPLLWVYFAGLAESPRS